MERVVELLKSIERRLTTIESIMARPPISDVVCKSMYSCTEVADLTQTYGLKKYRPFTVRLACKDGRIADVEKLDDGTWAVPRAAVLRLLEEGIPPERRNGRDATSQNGRD